MDYFIRKGGRLFCEGIPLTKLAKKYGTPLYVYSLRTFVRHLKVADKAFGNLPHGLFYSVKSNSNMTLLRVVAELGHGCDVVSIGEYLTARKAGIKRIIFSGVGKPAHEIETALKGGLLFFGVESENELFQIEKIARKLGKCAPISIRINPDIDPKTHPHIATGLKKEKFGIPASRSIPLYEKAAKSKFIEPVGISLHIGSQVVSPKPYVEAVIKLKQIFYRLSRKNILLRYIDLGGGWAAPFSSSHKTAMPADYVAAMLPYLKDIDAEFLIEPGRSIVGNAGVLLTKLIYLKQGRGKTFAVVDAGMNDLIRPALYNSIHSLEPVVLRKGNSLKLDIVGPICENTDTFARGIRLPHIKEGDYLAFRTTGAYGFSMSSNYNSRLKPAEILVDGDKDYLIRERDTFTDLWRKQRPIQIKNLQSIEK